jgi:hypothetical protein
MVSRIFNYKRGVELKEKYFLKKGSFDYPFESNSIPVTSCILGRKSIACSAGNLLIILLVCDSITDT